MTQNAEIYFLDGCGRCALGGTPDCKVHRWHPLLLALRRIVLECGLTEACKWGVPCYTYEGKNIALISALKDNCFISFFKGALLQDEHRILSFAGENSQVDKMIRFTRLEDVLNMEEWIKNYLFEAIEVEKAGLKTPKSPMPELPEELLQKFAEVPALKMAFEALPPGKQKGWILHFSAPKQAQTREGRIINSLQKILNGEGLHDYYKKKR
jgi:uncharacterized protein YdeI (YjbR/CyaY-like superfamily)